MVGMARRTGGLAGRRWAGPAEHYQPALCRSTQICYNIGVSELER